MVAEALAQAPEEQKEQKPQTPAGPENTPGMAARAAEFVLSRSLRTASGALMLIPRAVSRFALGEATDGGPKLLEARTAENVALDMASEEDVVGRALAIGGDQLERDAWGLVHAFREDLGDMMREGEVVMLAETDDPETDDPYGVTVKTTAHDSGKTHETEAVIDIDKMRAGQERQHVAHVAIRAAEPTIGGLRTGRPIEPTMYVEGAGIGSWTPDQTVQSTQRAIDRGDVSQIALVH